MKIAIFFFVIIGSLTLKAAQRDIDLLNGFCSSNMPSIEKMRDFAAEVGSVEGKPRVACGISGENYPICKSCDEKITPEQMNVLLPMLNKPSHREWHKTWHDLQFVTLDKDKDAKIQKYVQSGWLKNAQQANEIACAISPNDKTPRHGGESFFLMHREMLKMAQVHLVAKGLGCFRGWDILPEKVDNSVSFISNDPQVLQIRNMMVQSSKYVAEKPLQNEAELKKMSLDQLGCRIENELHAQLHQAFSAEVDPCQNETDKEQAKCNFLIPPESSPLNPHFWMIHGYIDSYIGKWLKANDYSEISTNCAGRPKCYQWKSDWVGKRPSDL